MANYRGLAWKIRKLSSESGLKGPDGGLGGRDGDHRGVRNDGESAIDENKDFRRILYY